MHALSVTKAKEFLRHIAVRKQRPVMMWGSPGVGKSQLVAQLCDEYDALMVDIRLSQYDSVDLRGIPNVVMGMTTWNIPATLPFAGNDNFPDDQPIFLFLDEINSAHPSVLAVAYQLVNDRAVGEHKLKPNVIIIAAGNREGDRGVTTRMPTPLANRFQHLEVIAEVEAVSKHFMEKGLAPVGIAFLNFRKPLLNTFDASKPDKAFATPRSWEKALEDFADDLIPEDTKMAIMAGTIGDGPAGEFWGFVDVWHKVIPIKEIMADPKGCRLPEANDQSMAYAVAVNCSGHMTDKTVGSLHTYLSRMDSEFVVLAWQMAVQRDKKLYSTPEFLTFSKQFKAIFQN